MSIKLSDYIKNPQEAFTLKEWIEIYYQAGEFDKECYECDSKIIGDDFGILENNGYSLICRECMDLFENHHK